MGEWNGHARALDGALTDLAAAEQVLAAAIDAYQQAQ
jgi:hypothetical protein